VLPPGRVIACKEFVAEPTQDLDQLVNPVPDNCVGKEQFLVHIEDVAFPEGETPVEVEVDCPSPDEWLHVHGDLSPAHLSRDFPRQGGKQLGLSSSPLEERSRGRISHGGVSLLT